MSAKVLFVDDEPDQAKLVQRMFRNKIRAGEISFLFASDGEEALDILHQEPGIDLVVSDINMPRMDGLTLLERLSQEDKPVKAVIVSAYGDMDNIRSAMNKGAFDFVTKPVDFEDLEATIKKTLAALEELRDTQRQLVEAERVRTNLSRFFSPNLAYQLVNNPEELEVGSERKDLTFLFTDVTEFTALVENSEPALIVTLLNEYLDEMTNIVFDHGGTIDKVVGDAIHAIFGAPQPQPDHARRAVQCALDMDAFATEFMKKKQAEGIALGPTRIGVNSGAAMVGNFGGETLFDYTAHGEAINIAARLETANKVLGTRICVSGETVSRIRDFHGRPVGALMLRGKTDAVEVFEPLPADDGSALDAYSGAYQCLAAGEPGAVAAFEALAETAPDDPLVVLHLGRLRAGETGTTLDLR
ncbi:MAG: response regulator [Gammaproteobacteria bacterium]|jgi:adenylate cyclase|nr:response regulator [Gammaproteobacteria bacterium]